MIGSAAIELEGHVPSGHSVRAGGQVAAQGADPPFGGGVGHWCVHWGRQDLEAFGGEDRVGGGDEMAATITHDRAGVSEQVGVTVSMVAKSQATAACERKNSVQVMVARVGAGWMPVVCGIRQTVEAPTRWPSRLSSAVMRR